MKHWIINLALIVSLSACVLSGACTSEKSASDNSETAKAPVTDRQQTIHSMEAKTDTTVARAQLDMLYAFLGNNAGETEEEIYKYCMQNVIDKLHDAYAEEFDDTPGALAAWAINGRWDSSAATLDTITATGADTYIARFDIQSDNASSPDGYSQMEYRLAKEGSAWKIADYRQHKLSAPF